MVPRLGYGVDGSSPETRIPEQLATYRNCSNVHTLHTESNV